MNELLSSAREFMKREKVDFLLVNSTNEFLVEYNDLKENARYKLTGFSGSTGDALLGFDRLYLFVDGRYHIQADLEVNPEIVAVVKLLAGQSQLTEMAKQIPANAVVGVCSKKNSQARVEAMEKHFKVKLLQEDGIETSAPDFGVIEDISEDLCGLSSDEKISKIQKLCKFMKVFFLPIQRMFRIFITSVIFQGAILQKLQGKLLYQNTRTRFLQAKK